MKHHTCKVCKKLYSRRRPTQTVCGLECGAEYSRRQRAKSAEKAAQAQRRALRERRRAMKPKSEWLKEAQTACNAYIRFRDRDKPCVSCGRYHQGQYHAGHYRTTKAMSALRFNELNIHKQCSACNTHLSGNIAEYRIELIRRIGVELVEWLERDHPPTNWTVEELKRLKKYYRDAVKEAVLSAEGEQPF